MYYINEITLIIFHTNIDAFSIVLIRMVLDEKITSILFIFFGYLKRYFKKQ